jgi:DNA segregation ATPase FtsK/SpoIIIE, S-DNA-T family
MTDNLTWLIPFGLGFAVLAYVLHKVGKAIAAILEAAAALGAIVFGLYLLGRTLIRCIRWCVKHWRTTLAAAAAGFWLLWWGWLPVVLVVIAVAAGLGGWRLLHLDSFDPWIGRRVRAWWRRWGVYARKMPAWLAACDLTVREHEQSVTVNVNPLRRNAIQRQSKPLPDQVPVITGVRSGPSWDEVKLQLVPGLTPEDFDEHARQLAVAAGVARCQVREIGPAEVSVDFQRQDLLGDLVPCADLLRLVDQPGHAVDLKRVWSGTTEYGTPWTQPLVGTHTLNAGATGAGKGSLMWCPLVSIAPAIRDGLVRPWGIDPKGMELAYGRDIFADRYAVTGKDALTLLDELLSIADQRKKEFAGRLRTVPTSVDYPHELLEFDEIGALMRYIGDRKLREQITERVSLLTTQGRALGITVRGYVQEPTKDTVPVRELLPRRVCLRVAAKSHVSMVLGDQAYERGAWANRIREDEPGVGYLFGEGIREPLRIRSGWVPDATVKALEAFVTKRIAPEAPAKVVHLPRIAAERLDRPDAGSLGGESA